jgi:hypothetical protein
LFDPAQVEIEPLVLLPVGGEDTLAFLSCGTCLPSWQINYVPIDTPWSVVKTRATTASKCPGVSTAQRGDRLAFQSSRLTGIHGRRRMRPGKGDSSDGGFVERNLGGGSEAAKAVSFTPFNWNARWLAHPG